MEKLNFAEKIASISAAQLSSEEWLRQKAERANAIPGNLKGYDCPNCLNRGFTTRIDENGFEISVPCSCLKVRASLRAVERSGLKGVLNRLTFDSFIAAEPWQVQLKGAAERFAKNPDGAWFFVGGNPGSGKTHICTAICSELLNQGREVRYFVWPSDIRRLKTLVNDGEYDSVFSDFANADVLYIDDLFKARSDSDLTAADISRTFELVNRRDQQADKITIFSSERNIQAIIRIDEATGSRIFFRARGTTFDLGRSPARNWRLYGNHSPTHNRI